MSKTTLSNQPAPAFLSVLEAALLVRLHPVTVRREIRLGRLRAYRAGEVQIRIPRDAIDEWLKLNPAAEPATCRDPRRHRGESDVSRPGARS